MLSRPVSVRRTYSAWQEFCSQLRTRVAELTGGVAAPSPQPDSSTNYNAAFRKAFEVVDATDSQSLPYDKGCNTVYLFLTDGAPVYEDTEDLGSTIGACYKLSMAAVASPPSSCRTASHNAGKGFRLLLATFSSLWLSWTRAAACACARRV